jgi:hypothetical protein
VIRRERARKSAVRRTADALARLSRSRAQEDEKSVAQKADAAEREHQTHEKLNAWANPLLD